jgi:hypothetical protein
MEIRHAVHSTDVFSVNFGASGKMEVVMKVPPPSKDLPGAKMLGWVVKMTCSDPDLVFQVGGGFKKSAIAAVPALMRANMMAAEGEEDDDDDRSVMGDPNGEQPPKVTAVGKSGASYTFLVEQIPYYTQVSMVR